MPREKKPPTPAPPVASPGCSSLMSCLSLQRRGPPQVRVNDDDAVAEKYWKRVHVLEEEIRRLTKWLGHEEERPASSATECVVRSGAKGREEGCGAATDRVRNGAKIKAKVDGAGAATECVVRNCAKAKDESTSAGTDKTTAASTKRCVSVGHAAGTGVQGMAKLEDGSYLRELSRVGRPWERLAVQVSRPVIPEDAKSTSEVLDKMTAMRPDDLCKLLTELMPLKEIARRHNPGEPVRRPARLSSGDDLVEALLFKALDRMEELVLEGLKIQMSSSTAATDLTVSATTDDRQRRHEPVSSKNSMVHVVLVQVRDPKERCDAIGDPMIGLVEASLDTKDGEVKVELQGISVAGISFVNKKSSDGRCMMWSASLRQCKGPHHGGCDGCRCDCVRNPNRVFRQ